MAHTGADAPARGILVRASVAARELGLSVRAVRRLIDSDALRGKKLRGKVRVSWHVYRDALASMKAEARAPQSETADP